MFNDSSDMLEIDADFLKFFWTPDSFIVIKKSTNFKETNTF